jgi:hypothetical protein
LLATKECKHMRIGENGGIEKRIAVLNRGLKNTRILYEWVFGTQEYE